MSDIVFVVPLDVIFECEYSSNNFDGTMEFPCCWKFTLESKESTLLTTVVFKLHPSFGQRQVQKKDKSLNGFSVTENGYGAFTMMMRGMFLGKYKAEFQYEIRPILNVFTVHRHHDKIFAEVSGIKKKDYGMFLRAGAIPAALQELKEFKRSKGDFTMVKQDCFKKTFKSLIEIATSEDKQLVSLGSFKQLKAKGDRNNIQNDSLEFSEKQLKKKLIECNGNETVVSSNGKKKKIIQQDSVTNDLDIPPTVQKIKIPSTMVSERMPQDLATTPKMKPIVTCDVGLPFLAKVTSLPKPKKSGLKVILAKNQQINLERSEDLTKLTKETGSNSVYSCKAEKKDKELAIATNEKDIRQLGFTLKAKRKDEVDNFDRSSSGTVGSESRLKMKLGKSQPINLASSEDIQKLTKERIENDCVNSFKAEKKEKEFSNEKEIRQNGCTLKVKRKDEVDQFDKSETNMSSVSKRESNSVGSIWQKKIPKKCSKNVSRKDEKQQAENEIERNEAFGVVLNKKLNEFTEPIDRDKVKECDESVKVKKKPEIEGNLTNSDHEKSLIWANMDELCSVAEKELSKQLITMEFKKGSLVNDNNNSNSNNIAEKCSLNDVDGMMNFVQTGTVAEKPMSDGMDSLVIGSLANASEEQLTSDKEKPAKINVGQDKYNDEAGNLCDIVENIKFNFVHKQLEMTENLESFTTSNMEQENVDACVQKKKAVDKTTVKESLILGYSSNCSSDVRPEKRKRSRRRSRSRTLPPENKKPRKEEDNKRSENLSKEVTDKNNEVMSKLLNECVSIDSSINNNASRFISDDVYFGFHNESKGKNKNYYHKNDDSSKIPLRVSNGSSVMEVRNCKDEKWGNGETSQMIGMEERKSGECSPKNRRRRKHRHRRMSISSSSSSSSLYELSKQHIKSSSPAMDNNNRSYFHRNNKHVQSSGWVSPLAGSAKRVISTHSDKNNKHYRTHLFKSSPKYQPIFDTIEKEEKIKYSIPSTNAFEIEQIQQQNSSPIVVSFREREKIASDIVKIRDRQFYANIQELFALSIVNDEVGLSLDIQTFEIRCNMYEVSNRMADHIRNIICNFKNRR